MLLNDEFHLDFFELITTRLNYKFFPGPTSTPALSRAFQGQAACHVGLHNVHGMRGAEFLCGVEAQCLETHLRETREMAQEDPRGPEDLEGPTWIF